MRSAKELENGSSLVDSVLVFRFGIVCFSDSFSNIVVLEVNTVCYFLFFDNLLGEISFASSGTP